MLFYFDPLKIGFFHCDTLEEVPENGKLMTSTDIEALVLQLQDSNKRLDSDEDGNPVVIAPYTLTLEQAKQAKIIYLNKECDIFLELIKSGYPRSEIDSWPKQETEARNYINDPDNYDPKLLRSLAGARAIDVDDLALRVIQKADVFAGVAGGIIGYRQRLEDMTKAATDLAMLDDIVWNLTM